MCLPAERVDIVCVPFESRRRKKFCIVSRQKAIAWVPSVPETNCWTDKKLLLFQNFNFTPLSRLSIIVHKYQKSYSNCRSSLFRNDHSIFGGYKVSSRIFLIQRWALNGEKYFLTFSFFSKYWEFQHWALSVIFEMGNIPSKFTAEYKWQIKSAPKYPKITSWNDKGLSLGFGVQ